MSLLSVIQGLRKDYIQTKLNSDVYGEKSFEKAESRMLFTAIKNSIANAGISESEIDAIVAGDLLNQIISSTFAARNFSAGYLGVYNACATFTEALTFGAMLIDGKYLRNVVCATSSHFSSAERQYRYPLELGCTRPPQSQWTVTGAGSCVLSGSSKGVSVTCATIGKVVDFGVTDDVKVVILSDRKRRSEFGSDQSIPFLVDVSAVPSYIAA